MNKQREYQQLIEDVISSYSNAPKDPNSKGVYMTWCEDCHEINLWTYWQGRGHLEPKILLVGQDWGCPSDYKGVIRNIQEIEKDDNAAYFGNEVSVTDQNLSCLFKEIGYPDILKKRYDDLFFTNLCLGYRSEGTSGNLKKSWLKRDYGFFKRLVLILDPEIIICLGKDTFEGVLEALGIEKPMIRGYNTFIESKDNPVRNGHVKIYGFAHCGTMGTLNRNGGKDTSLDKQISDWKKILEQENHQKEMNSHDHSDEKIDLLLKQPYHVIDLLPEQVPKDSAGQFFAVEQYYRAPDRLRALHGKFADIILKLNCYYDFQVCYDYGDDWKHAPNPEHLADKIKEMPENGFVRVMLASEEAMIDIDGCDIYMTLYGGTDKLVGIVKRLAESEGLFFR